MNGIINVIKPSGMTSHDVVDYIRQLIPGEKVGHTGTLDPAAAGLLPVCIGSSTRLSSFLLEGKKSYRAVVKLGITTDTLDLTGNEISRKKPVGLKEELFKETLLSFKGRIKQTPPAYSAVKFRGKKLYELARKGDLIEVPTREISVYEIELINYFEEEFPEAIIDVVCSHGTYIRSLASDIGIKLECGASLSFLVRTHTGPFYLKNAVTLEEILQFYQKNKLQELIFPPDYILNDLNKTIVINQAIPYLLNGNSLFDRQLIFDDDLIDKEKDTVRVYDEKNIFYGLGKWKDTPQGLRFKMVKLLRK